MNYARITLVGYSGAIINQLKNKIMKVYKEMNLRDFKFWSGAKSNAETLTNEQLDKVDSILEELYPYGMNETEINNFFGFGFDTIRKWLGIEKEEDE